MERQWIVLRVMVNGSKDAGNCAFVHHGNQGLTYTDVFYGNPGGWGRLAEQWI